MLVTRPAAMVLPWTRIINRPKSLKSLYNSIQTGRLVSMTINPLEFLVKNRGDFLTTSPVDLFKEQIILLIVPCSELLL